MHGHICIYVWSPATWRVSCMDTSAYMSGLQQPGECRAWTHLHICLVFSSLASVVHGHICIYVWSPAAWRVSCMDTSAYMSGLQQPGECRAWTHLHICLVSSSLESVVHGHICIYVWSPADWRVSCMDTSAYTSGLQQPGECCTWTHLHICLVSSSLESVVYGHICIYVWSSASWRVSCMDTSAYTSGLQQPGECRAWTHLHICLVFSILESVVHGHICIYVWSPAAWRVSCMDTSAYTSGLQQPGECRAWTHLHICLVSSSLESVVHGHICIYVWSPADWRVSCMDTSAYMSGLQQPGECRAWTHLHICLVSSSLESVVHGHICIYVWSPAAWRVSCMDTSAYMSGLQQPGECRAWTHLHIRLVSSSLESVVHGHICIYVWSSAAWRVSCMDTSAYMSGLQQPGECHAWTHLHIVWSPAAWRVSCKDTSAYTSGLQQPVECRAWTHLHICLVSSSLESVVHGHICIYVWSPAAWRVSCMDTSAYMSGLQQPGECRAWTHLHICLVSSSLESVMHGHICIYVWSPASWRVSCMDTSAYTSGLQQPGECRAWTHLHICLVFSILESVVHGHICIYVWSPVSGSNLLTINSY